MELLGTRELLKRFSKHLHFAELLHLRKSYGAATRFWVEQRMSVMHREVNEKPQ